MTTTISKTLMVLSVLTTSASSILAAEHESELATHTGVYFEPKFIMTTGAKVSEAESTLDGDIGGGVGFDLGYSFTEYFALELDGSYTAATVTESSELEPSKSVTASFFTYGVNAVVSYPLSHHFIVLGKLGYGYEYEDLGSLEITGTEHGINGAVGMEYSFSPHLETSLEYEMANIESVRGDSLQLGLIYKF